MCIDTHLFRASWSLAVEDPTFLAGEMRRCMVDEKGVKTIMALYKQRCMANPALHLKATVEEATLRFMQLDKVAVGTQELVAAHARNKTWQRCAFSCSSFTAAHFMIGSKLGTWFDSYLVKTAVQTARGQSLAVELAISNTPEATQITQQQFAELCAVCGLWCIIRITVLPELAIGDIGDDKLENEFRTLRSFRDDILALRNAEPDTELKNTTGLTSWVLKHVPSIRYARDEVQDTANRQTRGWAHGAQIIFWILTQRNEMRWPVAPVVFAFPCGTYICMQFCQFIFIFFAILLTSVL